MQTHCQQSRLTSMVSDCHQIVIASLPATIALNLRERFVYGCILESDWLWNRRQCTMEICRDTCMIWFWKKFNSCLSPFFLPPQKISGISTSGIGTSGRLTLGSTNTSMKISATPMKPTISMVTTKTGNTQTVTLVQKPATGISSGPTQKIVSVNRPVFKVTPGPPGKFLCSVKDKMGYSSYCFYFYCMVVCYNDYALINDIS